MKQINGIKMRGNSNASNFGKLLDQGGRKTQRTFKDTCCDTHKGILSVHPYNKKKTIR